MSDDPRENYVPVRLGAGDPEDVEEGVSILRTNSGRVVMLPRSVKNLTGPAAEVVVDVQAVALEIAERQQVLDGLVGEARALGVSWNALGFCVGMSGEATRKRWGS